MMEVTNCPVAGASTVRSKKGLFARRLSLDSIFQPGSNSTPSPPSPSPKGLGSSLHKRFSSWGRRSNSIVGNILNLGVVHEQDTKPKGSKAVATTRKRRGSANSGTATILITYTDGNTEVFHGADGAKLKELLSQAAMDYRISSYRVIMDSARAILNSDSSATSIGESTESGEDETGSLPEGLIAVPVPEDAKFKIVYQLLKSERLYVNRLQSVLDSYAEPLRKFSSLSVEDHRVLFVGLEPIVSLSAMINSKLEDALKSWDPGSTKIGNQFSSTFWNHYEDYFQDYPFVKNLLKEKFETEDGFVEFCELRQGKSKYSLDQLLCLPVQRIPEYDKYLNDLLEKTDPGHSDYEDLKKAASKVRNMVREHEEEMGNMDNEKRMERVQEKFPHDNLQLCDLDTFQRKQLASRRKSAPGAVLFKSLGAKSKSTSNLLASSQMGKKENEIFRPGRNCNLQRQYLMEGHVEFATGMQTQDRYMFLFSDLLLVAKQKSSTTFKLKQRIRVRELWISSCIEDVAEITRPPDRSFVLGWPTTNVVATFRSMELKDTWLNKFKEQIEEEKRKEMMPKEIPIEILYKDLGQACSLSVENNTEARDIVKHCLVELRISESEAKDYQLWVKGEKDEYQYPLIGHELPYSIMLSHISDLAKANEEETLSGKEIQKMIEENQGSRKQEFILKHNKKSPKKTSHEDGESHQKLKKKGKSPLFNIFRKKKPQGKLFGHNLQDITTPENLIPKPVMDLMTILFREGPHTVGILRKSPNAKLLKELREKMDNGEECLNDPCPPLVVGGLLKEFLRSIPQSLMYEDLFEDWITVHNLKDGQEKQNKMKLILEKLPPCHFALLQHLLCVLFYIDKKSDENKMTAYNLSVCIAPSLLWAKGNPDPLATPAALIQCMIQNFMYIFGEESLNLFGEPVEQKARQDSSTDSDSMHSVLSTQSGMRRDDSSIDSLEREIHYSGDMDSSPKLRYSHLSPSNLSRDSGLMLSDTMLYDEENNNNNVDRREYSRSASHYIERDIDPGEHSEVSHSLDGNFFYSYEGQIPVPPPRKSRKKGSEPIHQSTNFDPYGRHSHNRGTSQPQQYNGMGHNDKSRSLYSQSMSSDAFSPLCKQRSTESLKSVEEGSEVESEPNVRDWGQRSDMGTLIKSDSGAHLFMDTESHYPFSSHSHPQKSSRARLARSAIIESTPPISPDSKYSLNSSHDSVLSDSSGSYVRQFSSDLVFTSPPHTPESDCDVPSWIAQKSKDSGIEIYSKRQYSQDDSEVGLKSGDFKHKFESHAEDHDGHCTSPSPVSPKASSVTSAISHSPLGVRHSFPLETSTTHVGSGSNTSKEAEDIIKSPKISVTYCSIDSLSKSEEDQRLKKPGSRSPNLDLYNSSPSSGSHMTLKTLKYMGRLGTSPPPRVVLHGLKQTSERKENLPMRASYDSAIISQVRPGSFDVTDLHEKAPSKVESLSSDSVSLEESDSEEEKVRYTSMLSLSLRPKSPPRIIDEPHVKSPPKQFESPSKRPEQPPSYKEAVERNFLIKQGILIDKLSPLISDVDGLKQKEASAKALQLYQQSLQKYQEQVSDKKFGPPSQQFEVKLDAVGEKADENLEVEGSGVRDSDYVSLIQPEKDPKKLYQQSLEEYMQQQHTSQNVKTTQPLALAPVSSLQEGQSPALLQSSERTNKDLLDVVCIQRSLSDVGDHVNKRGSWLRQKSPNRDPSPADSGRSVSPSVSNSGVKTMDSYGRRHPTNSDGSEGSLMKRPDQPPPYLDPPSYKREIADSSPRHTFRTVDRKPQIVGDSHRSLTARSLENLSQKFSTLTHRRESFEDEPLYKKSVILSSSVRNSPQRVSDSSRDSSVDVSSRDSSRSVTPQRDSTRNSGQRDSRTVTTNRDSPSFVNSRDSPQTVARSRDSSLSQSPSLDSLASDSSRSRASSLEPTIKRISTKDVVCGSVDKKHITMSQRDSPLDGRLRRSSVDSVDSRTSVNSKSVDSSNNSSQNPSRNASPSTTKSMSAKELPWSVKQLRSQFDTNKTSSTGTDPPNEAASHQNSTTAPGYNNPPLFPGKNDNLCGSSSSLSSSVSAKTNHNVTFKKKFGPQAWDSFSSTDESDSSHHSLYHRRDNSSSSEYEEWSYTDISYV